MAFIKRFRLVVLLVGECCGSGTNGDINTRNENAPRYRPGAGPDRGINIERAPNSDAIESNRADEIAPRVEIRSLSTYTASASRLRRPLSSSSTVLRQTNCLRAAEFVGYAFPVCERAAGAAAAGRIKTAAAFRFYFSKVEPCVARNCPPEHTATFHFLR